MDADVELGRRQSQGNALNAAEMTRRNLYAGVNHFTTMPEHRPGSNHDLPHQHDVATEPEIARATGAVIDESHGLGAEDMANEEVVTLSPDGVETISNPVLRRRRDRLEGFLHRPSRKGPESQPDSDSTRSVLKSKPASPFAIRTQFQIVLFNSWWNTLLPFVPSKLSSISSKPIHLPIKETCYYCSSRQLELTTV